MTISRGQMKRQLYEGGGIMSLSKEGIGGGSIKGVDMGSRIGFFNPFKEAKKIVKKTTKAVKKIASSDIGKAALIGAAAFGIPGTQLGGIFGRASFGGAAPGIFGFGGIGNAIAAGKAKFFPQKLTSSLIDEVALTGGKKAVEEAGKNIITGNIGKLATLGAVSAFLTKTQGLSPEQAEEEVARDPSGYLELYYRNLNPPGNKDPEAYEAEVREFVAANTQEYAVGGRVGFANGPVLPPDPTQPVNPFGPKPGDFGIEEDIPIKMASNIENDKIW
jgi:hypothetical protein